MQHQQTYDLGTHSVNLVSSCSCFFCPGIDARAPERTDRRSGLVSSPNTRPVRFSTKWRASSTCRQKAQTTYEDMTWSVHISGAWLKTRHSDICSSTYALSKKYQEITSSLILQPNSLSQRKGSWTPSPAVWAPSDTCSRSGRSTCKSLWWEWILVALASRLMPSLPGLHLCRQGDSFSQHGHQPGNLNSIVCMTTYITTNVGLGHVLQWSTMCHFSISVSACQCAKITFAISYCIIYTVFIPSSMEALLFFTPLLAISKVVHPLCCHRKESLRKQPLCRSKAFKPWASKCYVELHPWLLMTPSLCLKRMHQIESKFLRFFPVKIHQNYWGMLFWSPILAGLSIWPSHLAGAWRGSQCSRWCDTCTHFSGWLMCSDIMQRTSRTAHWLTTVQ